MRNSIKQDEFWLMPFGLFMDLWEGHRQYNGISKPKQNLTIDEIILYGIWVQREFTNLLTKCIAFVRTFVYNKSADEYYKTERSF